jgi:hypothetical protein
MHYTITTLVHAPLNHYIGTYTILFRLRTVYVQAVLCLVTQMCVGLFVSVARLHPASLHRRIMHNTALPLCTA